MKNKMTPVRLHLELSDDYLSDYQRRMLKRYGESSDGKSITRDILIPSDMPLHNLHYTIQKLFGWQNSHLRRFILPDDIYQQLTGNTVKGWANLVGVLFQAPSEATKDLFWDDDYKSGSINTWLRKKYTGPYVYGGIMEHPEIAKRDIQELLERFETIEVQESFGSFLARKKSNKNAGAKVLKTDSLINLTLDEMNATIFLEGGTESLLERLEVNKLLASPDEELTSDEWFPVTKELLYNYDFGDDWVVKITKPHDCEDLLEQNRLGEDELEEARNTVIDKHKPVCIHKEGISVLDDVGGLSGFADFLGTIYEEDNKEEASQARTWARSFGWNAAKISCKKML